MAILLAVAALCNPLLARVEETQMRLPYFQNMVFSNP